MKNPQIDPYAAEDIDLQVEKILRGLGNPEPPVMLDDVRELLRLDKQFYSRTNTGALREFGSKLKVGAKQVLLRPGLLLDAVMKVDLRALWLPDQKRILISDDLPVKKQRHAEAHEITHAVTPHHKRFLLGDNSQTLRRSCHDKLEAEANYGSGQLLFLQGRFAEEAQDVPRTFESIKKLASTFGNTLTMTLWRMVEEGHRGEPIFGLITVHPRHPGEGFDPSSPCKYFIESPEFRRMFGSVSEAEAFSAIRSYSSFSRRGPLGEGMATFASRNGESHRFHLWTFSNSYEALTLGTHLGPVTARIAVP